MTNEIEVRRAYFEGRMKGRIELLEQILEQLLKIKLREDEESWD